MIKKSRQFDLGLDQTRMKDKKDADRQNRTVEVILHRFFRTKTSDRWDIQMLADEVGMGKTFVALAVAYSVLEHMMCERSELELEHCYQKVLVITPNNSALFSKWQREVAEFVKRCVHPQYREEAGKWFSPIPVERIDELSSQLRRTGTAPKIIVANMNMFAGGKLRDYHLKRRFLLGILFRYWGPRFKVENRERLLSAGEGWPREPRELTLFNEADIDKVPFYEEEIFRALRKIENGNGDECKELGKLLEICKELSQKYVRDRRGQFEKIEKRLDRLYREVASQLIRSNFPLVIVDEAHNWKNHNNGYQKFVEAIGPRTRRLLLLTATPFQLRPEEILSVLELSDHLKPCPTQEESEERCARLKKQRETVIRPILRRSANASRDFAHAWSRLPRQIATEQLDAIWGSRSFDRARTELMEVCRAQGVASEMDIIRRVIEPILAGLDPDVRELMREALRLYAHNADLSSEMGAFVIRHRRRTEHRLFKVGNEYTMDLAAICKRPDSHLLHFSPGMDVRGEAELPHYLLMRCVSEMKNFRGRSSLGNALTGCYSTLLDSQEGKQVNRVLKDSPLGQVYLNLLMGMVKEDQDCSHPKVNEIVNSTVRAWESGEKTLIFCFRVNTAKRLKEIIEQRIKERLDSRRRKCLGGEEKIRFLRSRLTSRDRDLVSVGLDRVLFSFAMAESVKASSVDFAPEDLTLRNTDLLELSRLSLAYDVDLTAKRVDRVFLNRAVEYVIAKRLLDKCSIKGPWRTLLEEVARDEWIKSPYGLNPKEEAEDTGAEQTEFDERGVHTRYEVITEPDLKQVERRARQMLERREKARQQRLNPILDHYTHGPNLWLGIRPLDSLNGALLKEKSPVYRTILEIHLQLFSLTKTDRGFDWEPRRKVIQAMRRALLRESVLLRLLPDGAGTEERGWGRMLVESFHSNLPGQNESMADRIRIFLEDLMAASGDLSEPKSARSFVLSATRLTDQNFVALVTGKTHDRERAFAGFNTPLLPEVLICTAVGQEGIDLHRHCRQVIHYDLAWNPAVLEQRTGRADRIGSKTFRERSLASSEAPTFLEIGVPFLAGTYDERMYEELRLRAQVFEVLTGGDLAFENVEGHDDRKKAEGKEREINFVPLPGCMVKDLRVKLEAWQG